MTIPRISVILPTLNRAALLPRAMHSVLRQSCGDLELIVVDDGSTDATPSVVASFRDARVIYLRNDRPTGDAAARNVGAARARAEWLAFQDSDDEWVPHSLARRLELAVRAGPQHAAVGSALARLTPSAVQLIDWPIPPGCAEGEVERTRFVASGRAYLQSMLIRRSAFAALGGFDTSLPAGSDVDLCLRLIRHHGMLATTELLALSYETPDGLSLDPVFRRDAAQRLYEKHGDLLAADPPVHARFLYDLAKAELACERRRACMRTAARALRLDPWAIRTWILLALAPFGARGLHCAIEARRRLPALR